MENNKWTLDADAIECGGTDNVAIRNPEGSVVATVAESYASVLINLLNREGALEQMFRCQKDLNARIGIDTDAVAKDPVEQVEWLGKFCRAITQETGELLDSTAWKWWRDPVNHDQAYAYVTGVLAAHAIDAGLGGTAKTGYYIQPFDGDRMEPWHSSVFQPMIANANIPLDPEDPDWINVLDDVHSIFEAYNGIGWKNVSEGALLKELTRVLPVALEDYYEWFCRGALDGADEHVLCVTDDPLRYMGLVAPDDRRTDYELVGGKITNPQQKQLLEGDFKVTTPQFYIDQQNARVEVIDLFHFIISAAQVLGMSAEDVFEGYKKKNAVNFQRQDDGYTLKDEEDSREVVSA